MPRFYRKISISILLFVLIFPIYVHAETLILKSGKKIEGKILERTDKYIKIDFEGIALTYWLDEIERIERLAVSVPAAKSVDNNSDSISEEEVKSFLERQNIIANKMDVDSFSQTLADDFKAVVFMGNRRIEFSRQEYIENLRQSWQLNKDYSCKSEVSSIKVTGAEAIVESKEKEKMTLLNGQKINGESFQKTQLEKTRGAIKQKFTEARILDIS